MGHAVALHYKPEGRRFEVRFPMVSLELFIDIEMSTRNISWGAKAAGA